MNPNGPVQTPDLRALLNAHRDEIFASLNCHQIGIIQSYDRTKQTATIKIAAKRVVYNQTQVGGELQQTPNLFDYPLLVDVPVLFPTGGNAFIFFPVTAGDNCLVLFNDRDIDNWFKSGTAEAPNTSRMHSLADGIAIVGLRNSNNPPTFDPAGYVGLSNGHTDAAHKGFILIDEDGNISIGSGALGFVILNNSGEVTLQNTHGARVTVNPDGKIIISADGSSPSMIFDPATDKITMSAAGNTMKSLLDTLCGVLTAWVNTGGSTPNPATVAAIAALKVQIDDTFA